ncbi:MULTISPECIES: polyamine ABC transporter substrate-binding protein [Pseudomonas]|uniref:polyamine ABC transporter substrate-binding protein n=1 Tax=Pseudomonas TaxID=286 RepID=UPI00289C1BD3|nr:MULTISPECIES: polyamine ABC transporter substrate-binding protein [Pseudomonas]
MKAFGKTLLALSLAGAFAGHAMADDKVLHVYNWNDYIAEDTIAKFEKETGIKVVYDVYDSNEVLEAKLLAGKSGYDVVVPSNSFLAKQIKAGVYQTLDRNKLPNWKNLDPQLMKTLEVSDPGNLYAIPYLWGTIGIGYNPDKVKAALGDNAPVDSWDLIFKPENISKLKSCGVALLDSPTEIIPAGLHYLGYKPDSQDTQELKAAQDLFMQIRPSITYFHSSKYISDLANGNVCVAVGYSGDIAQAKARAADAKNGVTVKYNIPKEGAGTFFDTMAIPKDATNTEGAYKFIDFIMKPEIIAEISDYVQYPNGNKEATPLVSDEVRNDPGIYPTQETMGKLYAFPDLPAKVQRAMTRAWTTIKSGK